MKAATKAKRIQHCSSRDVRLKPFHTDAKDRRLKFFALAGSCPALAKVPPHAAQDLPRD